MSRYKKSVLYLSILIISWIIILVIPSFRDMFLAQTSRGGYTSPDGGTLPGVIPRPEPDFDKLAKQQPDSLTLRLQVLKNSGSDQPIDALLDQFPHSPVVLTYTLNHYFRQMRGIRIAGRLVDVDSIEHEKQGIPSPERRGERNYTQKQWQHVIDLCKRGQKLAPQNAYFDIVEAYWQFQEFHDEAAWAAIARARTKSTFDTYKGEVHQRAVQAFQTVYGRPLYWEEIENVMAPWNFEGQLELALRKLARIITWEAIKAQKRGDNKTAARIYSQSFDVLHKRYETALSLGDSSSASGLELLIMSGPRAAGIKPDKGTKQVESSVSAFKNYAISIGRPDLVRYATTAKADYDRLFVLNDHNKEAQKPYMASAFVSLLSWRIGVLLLLLLAGASAIWLLSLLFTKVLLRRVESKTLLTAGEYWRGAISFAAFPASLLVLAIYAFSFLYTMMQHSPDYYLGMFDVVAFSEYGFSQWHIVICGICTAIIFSVAFAWRRVALLHQNVRSKVLLWKILGAIGSAIFVVLWVTFAVGKFPVFIRSWRIFEVVSSLAYGTTVGFNQQSVVTVAVTGLIIGLLIYLFNSVRLWLKIDDKSAARRDFWHLLCGSALRWIALASVLYLLTLAIAIPIRAPLHERTIIKMNHGELALIKMKR